MKPVAALGAVKRQVIASRQYMQKRMAKPLTFTHEVGHMAYFFVVFIEAHGLYGMMGGVLFVVGVVSWVVGMPEDGGE